MELPRLIPRLTWSTLVTFVGLTIVSLILCTFTLVNVGIWQMEKYVSFFASRMQEIYGDNRSPIEQIKESEAVIRLLHQGNPFIPVGTVVYFSFRSHDYNIVIHVFHNNNRVIVEHSFIRNLSRKALLLRPNRKVLLGHHGVKVLYKTPLKAHNEVFGEMRAVVPIRIQRYMGFFLPIIALCLIFLCVFTFSLVGWIKKIKKNIDLLYLSLEKDHTNVAEEPPHYVFEEFWQVAQWNMAVTAQIQESIQLQSTLFQNSPCGILIVNPEGKLLEVNSRAWEMLKQITNPNEIGSIHEINPAFQGIASSVFREGRTDTGELSFQGQHGEIVLIYAISPIQMSTWKGAVMFWLDHTEVKRLGSHLRQTERYQLVGELASMAAHELRNPLTTIIANAQLGQIIHDETKQQELFQRIQQASGRMNDFLKELLGLCRPGEAELSPMGLTPVINEVIGLLKAQLLTQGIELELKVEENLPRIWGEEKLLRQVLLNIMQNAIQAMPNGGRLILRAKSSGNEAILTVQDTGNGIPAEIQSKVFDSFITSKENGTGLGLFITRQIMMQSFGGRIWFSTSPGEGTEFYLAFHLAEPLNKVLEAKPVKRYWTGSQSMIQ